MRGRVRSCIKVTPTMYNKFLVAVRYANDAGHHKAPREQALPSKQIAALHLQISNK